jgi:hypothetical protein
MDVVIRVIDLISDVLPFGRLWYGGPTAVSNAVDYAKSYSRSHDVVIRVYDTAGNVIETHEHGRFHRAHTVTGWEVNSYRKPYTNAQCVRAAGDCSTLTMIK